MEYVLTPSSDITYTLPNPLDFVRLRTDGKLTFYAGKSKFKIKSEAPIIVYSATASPTECHTLRPEGDHGLLELTVKKVENEHAEVTSVIWMVTKLHGTWAVDY